MRYSSAFRLPPLKASLLTAKVLAAIFGGKEREIRKVTLQSYPGLFFSEGEIV